MKTLHNQKRFSAKNIAAAGILVALSIVLKSYLSINLNFTRISFAWVPLIVLGIVQGPIVGGIGAILVDILGFALKPDGAYYPLFTVAYAFVGIVPGLLAPIISKVKEKWFFIINGGVVIIAGLGALWGLIKKDQLKIISDHVYFNSSTFSSNATTYIRLYPIHYALILVILIILILLPIVIASFFKGKAHSFSIEKIVFIVTITELVASLILNTWAVHSLYNLSIIVLMPKRLFFSFFHIPIYTYASVLVLSILEKTKLISSTKSN